MEHPEQPTLLYEFELGKYVKYLFDDERNVKIYMAKVIRLKSYTQKKLKNYTIFSNIFGDIQNNFEKSRVYFKKNDKLLLPLPK